MVPVGRDRELETIATFLEPAHDTARVLLLEGDAGIGKTTLWKAAMASAQPRYRVLRARPLEAETRISFATIADLVDGILDEVKTDLPQPQRRALELALLLAEHEGPPPEPQAIAFAYLTTLRLLSRSQEVLVAVDDVQWLDQPSGAVLLYAARRLEGETIRFLLARRTGEARDSLGLDHEIAEGGVQRIPLGPLSPGAIQRVVHDELDLSLSRPALHRIHTSSGGNPFYALELARVIARSGQHVDVGTPLPIPASLATLISDRLAALPGDTERALQVAALLSEPTVGLVGAILEDEPRLMPAVAAEIVILDNDRIAFTHPLFASSLASRIEPAAASELHRRIATLVADPEERARHLAQGARGPDPEVATALEEAAGQARRRGAPEVAAELLERALALTPAGHADRLQRLLAASDVTRDAGDWSRARELAEAAVEIAEPGASRARALLLVGLASSNAAPACLRAREEVHDDPALEARIHLALSEARVGTSLPAAYADSRAALAAAERAHDASLVAQALGSLAWLEGALNVGDPLSTLLRVAELERNSAGDTPSAFTSEFNRATLHMWHDRHDLARAGFEAQLGATLRKGDVYGQAHALLHLAQVEWRAGDWVQAWKNAAEALDTWPPEEPQGRGAVLWIAAVIAVHRGDLGPARAMGDEALTAPAFDRLYGARNAWVLGVAALNDGSIEEALGHLEGAARSFDELGIVEPGMLLFAPDLIDAYVAAGRLDEALGLSSTLERRGAELGRERASALGARGRGLVLAAQGDVTAGIAALEDAMRAGEEWDVPLERGRTLLALGTLQRRARNRRAARATLNGALSVFDTVGAVPLAERARRELERIGGRTASSGELTPNERRVAELVATGMSNKEVAATLVVSVHTVESALTSIYRKLEIRSRTELAHKLVAASKD